MKSWPLFFGILAISTAQGFEIELPKHYREDLEKKFTEQADVLWDELDRGEVETAVLSFITQNPKYAEVSLLPAASGLSWTKAGRVIICGTWHVFLTEWEQSYPSLKKTKWEILKLIVSIGYDPMTKQIREESNGEIRLCFQMTRVGPPFKKKSIHTQFESADYGETVMLLPFGGVELRKAKP